MLDRLAKTLRGIGRRFIGGIWRMGANARFFFQILMFSGMSFGRFHLTLREIFYSGVMSLIIIIVSGFFAPEAKARSLCPGCAVMTMTGA